jgi:hypothetical protein
VFQVRFPSRDGNDAFRCWNGFRDAFVSTSHTPYKFPDRETAGECMGMVDHLSPAGYRDPVVEPWHG